MEGFVTKRGHLITNWKVRWFLLDHGEVKYFTDKTKQVLKGRYILKKESIITVHADMGLNKNVLMIFTTSHPFRKKALYFSCDSEESKTAWFEAITQQLDALKSGQIPSTPKPTIISSTIQSVDNIASRINDTISVAVTKVMSVADGGESASNEADMEELLRGRPVPRLNRIERGISADSMESSLASSSKPTRPAGKGKRPSTHPSSETVGAAAPAAETEYTAADYDSSDTDGSANELYGSNSNNHSSGRVKSGSDAHRTRPVSGSQLSAQSAALAAEVLNSPLLQKKGPDAPSATSSSSRARGLTLEDSELPRVSLLVAEEAAYASSRKMNYNHSGSLGGSLGSSTAASRNRPEASAGSSKSAATINNNSSSNSNFNSSGASSATPQKKSSFTAQDTSWIKQAAGSPTAAARVAGEGRKDKPVGSGDVNAKGPETSSKSSKSSSKETASVPAAAAEGDNPWIEAYTPEGELYYYHKVSRLARWDKPEAHVLEAVESRMREIDLATERSLRERREDMDRVKQRERENEQVKEEKMGEIEKTVRSWAMEKQRVGRELSFPELLRDLVFILPSDLLLLLYETPTHKVVLDALQEFTVSAPPAEVKKAYLRVVRFIHPDKLPQELETASKLLVERVFIHLTQKYDLYRKAHELG